MFMLTLRDTIAFLFENLAQLVRFNEQAKIYLLSRKRFTHSGSFIFFRLDKHRSCESFKGYDLII